MAIETLQEIEIRELRAWGMDLSSKINELDRRIRLKDARILRLERKLDKAKEALDE